MNSIHRFEQLREKLADKKQKRSLAEIIESCKELSNGKKEEDVWTAYKDS